MKINTDLLWVRDLYLMGRASVQKENLADVQKMLLAHFVKGMNASEGSLAMLDDVFYDSLIIVAVHGTPPMAEGSEIVMGQGIIGYAGQHGQGLLLNKGAPVLTSTLDSVPDMGEVVLSSICFPLKNESGLIGVMSVYRNDSLPPFTIDDLAYCSILVNMVAMVLDNIRLHVEQQHRIQTLSSMNVEILERNKEVLAMNERLDSTQNQLQQSEKMASIGQLAAGVAHEINNPIGYVYSNLGTLEKYVQDMFSMVDSYEQAESAIGDVAVRTRLQSAREKLDLAYLKEDLSALMNESRDGITRVKKIVQNLKDFSHVDATDEWHFADLHKGLDSTLNIVSNEIKYKAEVVKEYGQIADVECIASQINQVFMNLLVNASHAIEVRGVITLRSGQKGNEVWLSVSDTGKGIPPENIKKIFDPFFTTKPVGKGTGLGLSLSYGIIKKHNGRIEVSSEVGKGTTFTVWLPTHHTQATAA